jgi:hypothetical protein
MSLTNATETDVLNSLYGGTVYLALYTVNPTETTSGTEVTGGAYARRVCACTVSGNTASNTATIEFPAATSAWGTVTGWAIMSALTGGTMKNYAALAAPRTVDTGDILRFVAGAIQIVVD